MAKKKKEMGRPQRDRDEIIALVTPLAFEWARDGGFWGTLPAHIFNQTNQIISEDLLNDICQERADFSGTKRICFALCLNFWDKKMLSGDVPPSAWIFIKKNLSKWRDRQPEEVDKNVFNFGSMSDEELRKMAKEILED